jgi:hypothetical protein
MFAISNSQAIQPEWLEMCQRLLSVDLVACFALAFAPSPRVIGEFAGFPSHIMKNGPGNFLIPTRPDHLLTKDLGKAITYHSEPRAQQVVLHVTTSLTAAILHQLKLAHIAGGGWSKIFANVVHCYLLEVTDIYKGEPDDWSHDAVVLALKTLLCESPADFAILREEVSGQKDDPLSSRHWFDRFFDYISSDNV